ncbi:thiamine pyrophosphate-binding protein [Bordetella sp. H567]|uniref:thiamine pyrophosphate-binding protein n=1 Tax=Bordetella sp. H567 TaxID=1697043 RepID=UPI0011AB6224|nr:thiamine pyrophosphate-binding protein [Bordetella sp. H567]
MQNDHATPRWGSDYLAALLRHIGLEYVALNPGASFRGLHDSLVNYLGDHAPRMLTVLHEEHAVAIAHGYAKVTGRPMGAILHANVGLMHASMAIFDAYCDRVPVLVFGATGPVDTARRRPWIDWLHTSKDQGALVRSFVKWDAEPASLEAARDAVLRARQIATTLPHGPAYVCFDSALQEAPCAAAPALPPLQRYNPPRRPGVADSVARDVARLLYAARRPLILAGRVSRNEEDWRRRVALAEHCGATVLTDVKVGAAFPTRHPLHGAAPGYFMGEDGLAALREADVILSLDWVDLAGTLRSACGADPVPAHVIQISLDQTLHNGYGGEHQGLTGTDTYLMCDPDEFSGQLLEAIRSLGTPRMAPPWDAHSGGARARDAYPHEATHSHATHSDARSDEAAGPDGIPLTVFARTISAHLQRNAPACLIRTNLGWPGGAHPFSHPVDYLGYDGGAGVGSGPGMSVGAALALMGGPRLPVAVLGDGDFLMGVTAFWTAVRYGIPLLVVVANNRSFFNDEVHQEKVAVVRGRPVENKSVGQRLETPEIDIAAMARAQGALAWGPVSAKNELEHALLEAVAAVRSGKVAVIDARVGREYAPAMANALTRGD